MNLIDPSAVLLAQMPQSKQAQEETPPFEYHHPNQGAEEPMAPPTSRSFPMFPSEKLASELLKGMGNQGVQGYTAKLFSTLLRPVSLELQVFLRTTDLIEALLSGRPLVLPEIGKVEKGEDAEKKYRLDSDVSVEELYRLHQDPSIKNIAVIFHAEWCGPCEVIETKEYQRELKSFNQSHLETRLVSMIIDEESDPLIKSFWKSVGPMLVSTQDQETGEIKTEMAQSVIPTMMCLDSPSGKYFRTIKFPEEKKEIEKLMEIAFRKAEPFKKELPKLSKLDRLEGTNPSR